MITLSSNERQSIDSVNLVQGCNSVKDYFKLFTTAEFERVFVYDPIALI